MPNICDNRLVITHENKEILKEFYEGCQKEMNDNECYFLHSIAQDRCWVRNVDEYHEGDEAVTIDFDSAWNEPVETYQELQNRGFEILSAMYYEPGMGFCGYHGGENYEIDPEDLSNIPNDLKSFFAIEEDFDLDA